MDSMRSLNTSLPSSTPRPQPPEQLLQSFKAAALSVTNLYKNAVYEQAQAKQAGYQEAIEDLLQFLDKENLGLSGGEGSKIRQWAADRSDGTGSPSDDDDLEKHPRTTSPRKEQPESDGVRQPPKSTVPDESVAAQQQPTPPAPQAQAQAPEAAPIDRSAVFTFSAGPSFPSYQEPDVDMQPSDNSTASSQDSSPVSVSVLSRNPRQPPRHNNFSRTNPRASTREPSVGLGSKRKFAVPDFFDISGLGNRDIFGGGKRGRFT